MSTDGIQMPLDYHDDFNDNSHPYKTKASVSISGHPVTCYYHAGHRLWYPSDPTSVSSSTPQIQLQAVTPVTLPQNTYITSQFMYAVGPSEPTYIGY